MVLAHDEFILSSVIPAYASHLSVIPTKVGTQTFSLYAG